jgi:glucuronate isomerase
MKFWQAIEGASHPQDIVDYHCQQSARDRVVTGLFSTVVTILMVVAGHYKTRKYLSWQNITWGDVILGGGLSSHALIVGGTMVAIADRHE